jgi:hypothetical protein
MRKPPVCSIHPNAVLLLCLGTSNPQKDLECPELIKPLSFAPVQIAYFMPGCLINHQYVSNPSQKVADGAGVAFFRFCIIFSMMEVESAGTSGKSRAWDG